MGPRSEIMKRLPIGGARWFNRVETAEKKKNDNTGVEGLTIMTHSSKLPVAMLSHRWILHYLSSSWEGVAHSVMAWKFSRADSGVTSLSLLIKNLSLRLSRLSLTNLDPVPTLSTLQMSASYSGPLLFISNAHIKDGHWGQTTAPLVAPMDAAEKYCAFIPS